jgi:polyisoprenyl-teichoic acid--peptidoglycan teichoic acid transferase
MTRSWKQRALWGVALSAVTVTYAACAWLWAAPYRGDAETAPNDSLRSSPAAALSASRVSAVAAPPPPAAPSASTGSLASPAHLGPPEPAKAILARTPPLTHTRNFLLVGLDRRPDGSGPALADSLIVVVLDEQSEHVGLVSIPRDLYVELPEGGQDRINTVYQVAKRAHRDPLALLGRVVEDTLKLPIEHAIALDLGVFERAVDAVGGVDVQVPCAIKDNFVDPRVEGGRRLLDLDPGEHHLDGATAAMYARSRHGRSDFHRARRQQAILLGVQRALGGLGVLQLPDLVAAFESSLETDLRRIQLLALARRALTVDPAHLHGILLGHEQVESLRTPDGKAVLLPRYEAIDDALSRLFSAPSPGVRPAKAACEPKNAALGPS